MAMTEQKRRPLGVLRLAVADQQGAAEGDLARLSAEEAIRRARDNPPADGGSTLTASGGERS